MPFVRVKSSRPGDPLHEFDVAVAEFEANPGRYKRVGSGESAESRPPTYIVSEPPATVKRTKKKPPHLR